MADPRFFLARGPFTAAEIAGHAGAELVGEGNRPLRDVGPLDTAGADALAYFDQPKYRGALAATRAGAVAMHPRNRGIAPAGAVEVEYDDNAFVLNIESFGGLEAREILEAAVESLSAKAKEMKKLVKEL